MEKEVLFGQTLEKIKKTAKEQGNCIGEEQVKEAFAELHLKEEQLAMVYEYLQKNRIGLGEPVDVEVYLSVEEKDYLTEYLEELAGLESYSAGEKEAITLSAMAGDMSAQGKLIEIYLPEVVDIAKLYAGQGVYLEDLVGEGNVALTLGVQMLGCLDNAAEAQGMLGKCIMDAMEEHIAVNVQADKKDRQMADKVNKVADAARELAEDFGRKVTISELAGETGMPVKAIEDAVRMSGDRIEDVMAADVTEEKSVE